MGVNEAFGSMTESESAAPLDGGRDYVATTAPPAMPPRGARPAP